MSWRYLPNALTIFRLCLVPFIISALFTHQFKMTLILFGIASLTDGLDGFLARRFGWASILGAILDPVSDLCLLVSASVVLWLIDLFPLWCLIVILVRDGVILVGALLFRVLVGSLEIDPLRSGKACAFSQMLLIMATILSAMGFSQIDFSMIFLQWATLFLCLLSGILYIFVWSKKWIDLKE